MSSKTPVNKVKVLTPPTGDDLGALRGSGRWINLLKDLCSDSMQFVDSLQSINHDDHLLIPTWSPFAMPPLWRRHTKIQTLVIFDAIPFKYPEHFPLGMRGSLKAKINQALLSQYDHIITISEHAKADICNQFGIPSSKVTVIYPTSPHFYTKEVKPDVKDAYEDSLHLSQKYVIYVGDVNWNKNILNLARAIKLAKVPCVFVGRPFEPNSFTSVSADHPWQQEFKEFIAETAYDSTDGDFYIFKGYVSDEELMGLYQNAAANILISRDEGFGLSYIEAGALGCPSILSDIDVFREIAGFGTDSTADDAALFTQTEDPYHIAEKVKEITTNDSLRNELGKKTLKNVQRFSPEVFRGGFNAFVARTS